MNSAYRKEVTDRAYRVFTYQSVDRVPDFEFGYWPQTIRRWLNEGLPKEYETEKNQMFSAKLDAFFGMDSGEAVGINSRTGMNPPFEEEVLETKTTGHVVMRGGAAIDHELERLRPLLEQGGYIPHLDHLVPPDISYRNYREYREKKLKLIGKG